MKAKKLGIWMDHQHAHVMEFMDPIVTKIVSSKFTHAAREISLHTGENGMHTKEQHQQAEYYRTVADIIKGFESVLLFGPTDAKVELLNTLSGDAHFAKVKIEVKQADKMTENQEHAFVRDYFSK